MNTKIKISELIVKLKELRRNPLIINILVVGGITLILKLLGFYKEMLIASTFGLSSFLDAFLLAVIIPTFIQNVFIGALRNIFIPNYIAEISSTKRIAEFQTIGFVLVLGIVAIFSVLALLFSEFLLELTFPNHDSDFYESIRTQLYIILPCILFWGLSSILGGLLEVANKFMYSTLSTIFIAVTTIIFLLFFKDFFGETVLALGLLIGSVLSFFYLLFGTLHFNLLFISKPKSNENVKTMLVQLPPKITSGFLTSMNTFVDQFFAAQLVAGSVSALSYGIKVPSFGVSILMIAIGNVLLPHFSRMINDNITSAFVQLFGILKIVFLIGLGAGCFIFLFSEEIIYYLFERNEFTAEDTTVVSLIQQITIIYLPFYLCTLVLVKFLTSYNKNVFMAWASFFNLILNFILNWVLIKKYGIFGLALSTTMVYILNSLIYFIYTYRQYKRSFNN